MELLVKIKNAVITALAALGSVAVAWFLLKNRKDITRDVIPFPTWRREQQLEIEQSIKRTEERAKTTSLSDFINKRGNP